MCFETSVAAAAFSAAATRLSEAEEEEEEPTPCASCSAAVAALTRLDAEKEGALCMEGSGGNTVMKTWVQSGRPERESPEGSISEGAEA